MTKLIDGAHRKTYPAEKYELTLTLLSSKQREHSLSASLSLKHTHKRATCRGKILITPVCIPLSNNKDRNVDSMFFPL